MEGEQLLNRTWRKRTKYGHGQLLAVGDKLLIHGENGVLALAKLDSNEFNELAKIDTVKGFCWNTIALYGDLVLVRSERQAACYRLPIKGDPIAATVVEDKKESDADSKTLPSGEEASGKVISSEVTQE